MSVSTQDGRVALVTGAAGGLGTELAREFVAQGWRVVAGWHRCAISFEHERVLPVRLDVTDRDAVEAAVGEVLARWGGIDVLVSNAGLTADGLTARLTDAQWDRVLAVNLKGAFHCARAVLPSMIRRREGHIIHVSSFSARCGHAGQSNYAAAKAGVIGLTESLAREVGKRDVRVNCVLPGVLPTAMTASLSPDRLAELAADSVLGRINSPGEVARFIVFLAGMRNVSGQVFQLDGRIGRWT
jgi:3-oxoacyl-[acyl-carrier protein] reductase